MKVNKYIVSAALKIDEIIISIPQPARHNDIEGKLRYILDLNWTPNWNNKIIDGFITSEGEFVDRIEAGKIALSNGQVKDKLLDYPYLYSEDLW